MLTVIDAPTNLGLRPRPDGTLPGCDKGARSLREAGLFRGLVGRPGGTIPAPAYDTDWAPGDGCRNAEGIARHATDMADCLEPEIGRSFSIVLGGDCSVLIGAALAMRRRGRYGLVFIDGHGDFRHPGNGQIEAAAGEDLAIVTGRGDERLIDLEGRGPLIDERDVVVLGVRRDDRFRAELEGLGVPLLTSDRIASLSPHRSAQRAIDHATGGDRQGFWIHLDVDVLDPRDMPAVDSPTPGGLSFAQLGALLAPLVADPLAIGLDVCIYDPDLDADGSAGRGLVETLHGVFAERVPPV